MPPSPLRRLAEALGLTLGLIACGEQGLLPTTVEAGPDFSVADVVFEDAYYYCRVEPILFAQRCGPGDPALGEAANGCHHNVTSFRLADYMPLVAESCGDGVVPGQANIPAAAQQNYQSAQARMKRNPDAAPLLQRATGRAQHPRTMFEDTSPEAEVIRQWATQYSTQ
jgi:hypothetical protein